MEEISFVNDPSGQKPKPAAKTAQNNVQWTEPPAEEKSADGWLGLLKNKETVQPANRAEAMQMIKQFVREKEQPAAAVSEAEKEKKPRSGGILAMQSDAGKAAAVKQPPGPGGEKRSEGLAALLGGFKGMFKKKPDDASSGNILTTNLIRNEVVMVFDWKRNILVLFFYIILSGLVLAGSYQALVIWEEKKINDTIENTQKFTMLNKQIAEEEKGIEEILIFQKKLELIKDLLNQHIYWTNFFAFLEQNTLFDVTFSGFSGDLSGEYTLAATGKDFKTLADQLRAFKANKLVEKAESESGTLVQNKSGGESTINFSLSFKVKPELFNKKIDQQ